MDSGQSSGYQPQPRWGHASITIGNKVYMWGGRTEAFSDEEKEELKKLIEVFDSSMETWSQHSTTGSPPPGLYNNAHTALGSSLYFYGGWDGQSSFNSLHQLESLTYIWKEIKASNSSEAPMKMSGCGMVALGDHKLVLFGGFVVPNEDGEQPGCTYARRSDGMEEKVEKGWINELRVFDLQEGNWSTPVTTGSCPPPCVDFTFTLVDGHRAVLFGGYQPETGTVADTYIIDMDTWHWTKLGPEGDKTSKGAASPTRVPWPEARDGHTACLLAGEPRPLLLVSGGWDKNDRALNDAWILDVNGEAWTELPLPVEVGPRFWHSVVSINYSLRLKQLLFFGGCPGNPDVIDPEGGDWPKLAASVMLELGQLVTSPVGEGGKEWVVMDAVTETQLGHPMRRMREKVLMAEYRAKRAEELAKEAMKKLQSSSFTRDLTPTPSEDSDVFTPTSNALHANKAKAQLPFWVIPREDVDLTRKEIGRGRWSSVNVAMYSGSRVAARCFGRIASEANRKVFVECMDLAAKLRHPNLLPFIGAVVEGDPIIITELMPNNLKAVLEKGPLGYHEVINISLDVARALNFLHSCKPTPVVHGELPSSSVLLEHERGLRWRAKLSDFMSAKFVQHVLVSPPPISPDAISGSPITSPVRSPLSSIGKTSSLPRPSSHSPLPSSKRKASVLVADICDPLHLSPKSDVYFYGLLMLEMCTQSSPLEVSMAYLLESTSIKWPEVSALIKSCIEVDPSNRPAMGDVITMLMGMEGSVFTKS